MTELVFPPVNAHFATVNGSNLVFSRGSSMLLPMSQAGFDFARNCSGLTSSESAEWLRARYGETSVGIASEMMKMVRGGYFNEPAPDSLEHESGSPMISFGIGVTHRCNMRCRYCFGERLRKPGHAGRHIPRYCSRGSRFYL